MSLYDGGELFGEKQYQDLASLPLPGPAVVIDVRHSALYGPQLLQNLAIETEDLATEMQLHKVYRWRNLAQWIDFLKLDPLPPSTTRSASTTFWLTPRTGEKKQSFTNPEELAAHLVGRYLD